MHKTIRNGIIFKIMFLLSLVLCITIKTQTVNALKVGDVATYKDANGHTKFYCNNGKCDTKCGTLYVIYITGTRTCTTGQKYVGACKCTIADHVANNPEINNDALAIYNGYFVSGSTSMAGSGYQFGKKNADGTPKRVYCGQHGSHTSSGLGHDMNWVKDKEPTCTEDGKKHKKCSRCNHTSDSDTVIDSKGHNFGNQKEETLYGITNGHTWEQCKRDCGETGWRINHQYAIVAQAGTGIDSVSVGRTASPTSVASFYDKGTQNISLSASVKPGYLWSKWAKADTNTKTGDMSNQNTTYLPSSGNSKLASPHAWTATATPIQYNVQYLRGVTSDTTTQDIPLQVFTYDNTTTTFSTNPFTGTKYSVKTHYNNDKDTDTTISNNLQFTGWLVSTIPNQLYQPGGGCYNLTTTNGATVNITAQWSTAQIDLGTPAHSPKGYHFKCWSYDEAGNSPLQGTVVTLAPSYTDYDLNFYAQYEPNPYSIVYSKGVTDIEGIDQTQLATYDNDVTTYAKNIFTGRSYNISFKANDSVGSTRANIPNDLIGNLEFDMWYLKQADYESQHVGENFEASKILTKPNFTTNENGYAYMQAKWKTKTIDLSKFTPIRKGYIFQGWFNSETGGTQIKTINIFSDNTPYTNTLYAHWKPITYKVIYKGNGNWNTEQGDYEQTLTFDKKESLIPNKFTRADGQDGSWSSEYLTGGYQFKGWTTTKNSWTTKYVDGETQVFNLCYIQDDTIDFYSIWNKDVRLIFDFNGGLYNNDSHPILLKSTIWNTKDNMSFKLDGTLTSEVLNKNNKQNGNIKAYGSGYSSSTGINSTITKQDAKTGIQYRFLGWNTNKNATTPLPEYDVYSASHKTTINIYDNLTLYAIYEPILTGQITTERVLGDLSLTLQKKATATAVQDGHTELIVRAGEQAQYTAVSKGTSGTIKVDFDEKITKIYDTVGLWNDNLNPNPSKSAGAEIDGISITAKHGLNRILNLVPQQSETRKFNIPQYLGTNDSEPSSIGKTDYTITFIFTNPNSYYWNNYKGTQEKAVIYTNIGLLKEGDTVENILELIRTKIKI